MSTVSEMQCLELVAIALETQWTVVTVVLVVVAVKDVDLDCGKTPGLASGLVEPCAHSAPKRRQK